jgi:hypothetical protein
MSSIHDGVRAAILLVVLGGVCSVQAICLAAPADPEMILGKVLALQKNRITISVGQ